MSMNRDREKMLERIRKCLRLAKSSNEHEAAAAMRQAQKMMADLNLTEAEVLAAEAKAKAFSAMNPSEWEAALALMVGETLGCKIIFSSGLPGWAVVPGTSRHGEWCFIGCNSAETVAQYAFVSLLRQLRKARAAYIANSLQRCGPASKRRRADNYCAGWVAAVHRKVEPLAISEHERKAIKAVIAKRSTSILKPREVGNSKGSENDIGRGFRAGSGIDLRAPISGRDQTLALASS